jgi:hypothetical protein
VRKSLTNERVSTQHVQNILGWGPHQVNEEDLRPPTLQVKNYR